MLRDKNIEVTDPSKEITKKELIIMYQDIKGEIDGINGALNKKNFDMMSVRTITTSLERIEGVITKIFPQKGAEQKATAPATTSLPRPYQGYGEKRLKTMETEAIEELKKISQAMQTILNGLKNVTKEGHASITTQQLTDIFNNMRERMNEASPHIETLKNIEKEFTDRGPWRDRST